MAHPAGSCERHIRLHRDLLQPTATPSPARISLASRARVTIHTNTHFRLSFTPKQVTKRWGRSNFKNGWFYPGDYGILQPGGSLTLGGRQSEFINAGGIKLDPVQLDRFAVALPHVLDACGFSYPDSSGMQQIGLAVVTSPHVDGQGIASSLEKAFGPAAPRLLVRVDEIPRNAMGKPLRAEIARHHTAPDIR